MELIEQIREKYTKWVGDEDESWEYDMIGDFFDGVLTRGEKLDIIQFLLRKPEENITS